MTSSWRDRGSSVARAARNQVSRILLTGLVVQALNLLSGPMVARMLGPEGRGSVAVVWVLSIVGATLGTSSLTIALSRTVAGAARPARDVFGGAQRVWLLWAVVPGVLAGACAYFALGDGADRWTLTALTTAVTITACWMNVFVGMLQGEQAVRRINAIRLTYTTVYVAIVVVLFVALPTDHAAVIVAVHLFAIAVSALMSWLSLREPTGTGDRVPVREVNAVARRSYLAAVAPLTLGIDYLVVGVMLTSVDLGLWAVAASVSTLPVMVLSALGAPLVARMTALGPVQSTPLMRRWVMAALAADLVLVAGMEVVIAPVIRLFFGEAFVPAIGCARVLMVVIGVLAFRSVLAAVAQAQNRGGTASATELISAVLMVVGVALGADVGGIVGAALGFLCAALFSCAALALIVSWRVDGTVATVPGHVEESEVPEKHGRS